MSSNQNNHQRRHLNTISPSSLPHSNQIDLASLARTVTSNINSSNFDHSVYLSSKDGDIFLERSTKKVKLDALSGDYLRSSDSKGGFLLELEDQDKEKNPLSKIPNEILNNPNQLKQTILNSDSFHDPPINIVNPLNNPSCQECQSYDIDFNFKKHFQVHVCKICREKLPDKYSLLTKTECRDDYLLTNSELQDHYLLPAWIKPNPHKSTWSDMYLYLRYQVEEFAWKKWGSPEQLDAEFEKREQDKKLKKEKKYNTKMAELRKKTRTSQSIKTRQLHTHSFGEKVYIKERDCYQHTCSECGITVEFDEF